MTQLTDTDILSAIHLTNAPVALVWFALGYGLYSSEADKYINNGKIDIDAIRNDIEESLRKFHFLWHELLKKSVEEKKRKRCGSS